MTKLNGVTVTSFTNSFPNTLKEMGERGDSHPFHLKTIGVRGDSHPIYVELHSRSAFSFLEGSSTPEELVARAVELKQPALALLDRDNVSGAARFHMAAKKAGIRAHIGAEVTCTDGCRYPLLAESRTGYQNLCRLITRMKMRAKKGEGAATLEEFAEYAQGLVCLAPSDSNRWGGPPGPRPTPPSAS